MKSIRIGKYSELFFLDGRLFILSSYDFDSNILKEVNFNSFTLIRSGSYAYCYDFLANLSEK